MIDRGLARRFPPGVERAATRGERNASSAADRKDLRDLPTFTIDPATAKDFDDAISAEQLEPERWRIWVHIADVSAYVKPGSQIDREALPARDERLRPGRGRADAPRGAVQRRLLAGAGPGAPGRDRRDGAARRGGRQELVPPLADPLRRAPRLRPRRPDLRRRRARRGRVGAAAGGRARRGGRAGGQARGARRAGRRVVRAGLPLRRPRARQGRRGHGADRVAPRSSST